MKPAYTGITGFTSRDEVEEVLACFPNDSSRKLMVGVLANSSTLSGKQPNKFPERYPKIGNIKNIFSSHPLALNIIHFNKETKEPRSDIYLQQLLRLANIGSNLHGFQLNNPWPNPGIIRQFKNDYPKLIIILSVNKAALAMIGDDHSKMAKRIKYDWLGLADYVEINPRGNGKSFDQNTSLSCLQAIETICGEEIGLVVAGGICHQNAERLLADIAIEYPDTSTNAQTKLHSTNKTGILNASECIKYIKTVSQVFAE